MPHTFISDWDTSITFQNCILNVRYCNLMLQVRDYIHVMDLASGHTKALDKLFTTPDIGMHDLSFINFAKQASGS